MKQPINPVHWGSWIKPKQKKHLIELRYKELLKDEEIKAFIEEKQNKLKDTIKELRKEIKSLKTDNSILKRQIEIYEKGRN